MAAGPETIQKVADELKQFVGSTPEGEDVGLVLNAAEILEMKGAYEPAAALYRHFAKIFAASGDRELAHLAAKMTGAARRMGLVGKKLEFVEGKFVDGQPVRWADYRGKVVLVVFWATWCRPCLRRDPGASQGLRSIPRPRAGDSRRELR